MIKRAIFAVKRSAAGALTRAIRPMFCIGLCLGSTATLASSPYPVAFVPGSDQERAALVKSAGSSVDGGVRSASSGQFWVYGIPLMPGSHCRMELTVDPARATAVPDVAPMGQDNHPLPSRVERNAQGVPTVVWTVPDNWPIGRRMMLIFSAKQTPVSLSGIRLTMTERDSRGLGVPDAIIQWMRAGLPPAEQLTVLRPSGAPHTLARVTGAAAADTDPQVDAVLLSNAATDMIDSWKARGDAVWNLFENRGAPGEVAQSRQSIQTGSDGKPILSGDQVAFSPTPDRVALERQRVDQMLAAGYDGICLDGIGYSLSAGYENSFKDAWRARYGGAWQDPAGDVDARYQAGRLMSALTSERINALLSTVTMDRPADRRLIELDSPLQSLQEGRIEPAWQAATQSPIEDVIGKVGPSIMEQTVRLDGARLDLPFAQAYLAFSSIRNATLDLGRRTWFSLDWPGMPSTTANGESQSLFQQAVVAALLFGDVNAYQIPLPTSTASPDEAAMLGNVNAVLASMADQPHETGQMPEDIGVLLSDTAQWQRRSPTPGDLDGLYGLAMPLLQRGIPLQIVSLERCVDPGYLSHFNTLLLSYDYQTPFGQQTQAALADWVRRGGSLLFFGGENPYLRAHDGWWHQAQIDIPQTDLWKQLGVDLGGPPSQRSAPPEDLSGYQPVAVSASLFRRTVSLDLTRFVSKTGSVAVRFSAASPASVSSVELRIGTSLAASFVPGSDIENHFLMADHLSRFGATGRVIGADASFTYRFDGVPYGSPFIVQVEYDGPLTVQAAPMQPDVSHTLVTTRRVAGLAELFPRLHIGNAFTATVYPLPSPRPPSGAAAQDDLVPLYTLRAGGTPIWMKTIGRGMVVHIGISPGFFSSSARSGGLLRALIRLAYSRAGGSYREPEALRVHRGRFTAIRTFDATRTVEGRTIDLFSPNLSVAEDRQIPPRSVALLADLGSDNETPHIGFVSGKVQAQLETATTTAFFVRGARASRGAARLHRGGKQLAGARAIDRMGRPVAIQTSRDGDTVLLQYANDPDGIAVRVGWQ